MPLMRRLDQQNTGGYDGSGINPSANQPTAPRFTTSQWNVMENSTAGSPPTSPLPASGFPQMPNGPMPTVPPGGIAPSPVPAPGGYDGSGINPGAGGGGLMLPGINGQQYVATANPYTGPTTGIPAPPGAGPVTAPSLPGYQQQTVPGAPAGFTPQNAPQLGSGWNVPSQYASINTVQDFMGNLLNSGNPYMANAQRRGLETAAGRGLLNSSMAAGAAQRSAIEAATPLLGEAMDTLRSREGMMFTQGENSLDRTQQERLQILGQNFQGGENAADRLAQERLQTLTQNFQGSQADLDRTLSAQLQAMGINADSANAAAARATQLLMSRESNAFASEQNQLNRTQNVNDMLLSNQLGLQNMTAENYFRSQMQADATMQQDWLQSQSFTRQFNAALSMIPISNAADLNNYLMQAAINEPEVYTPEVLSGMSQFFNQNLTAILAQYFPQGLNP